MEQGVIDGAVKLVQTVGLPTLFCLWLMFRVEKRLDAQTTVQQSIADAMHGILEHVRKGE